MENSRIYYINSENKESGTNSRFNYRIQIPDNSGFNRVCVLQASIPASFYLVQDGYNTFTVTEGIATRTITIDAGNYNISTFPTAVLALLNTGTFVYTMTISTRTAKFTYGVTGNSGVQPVFTFDSHLSQQFGFDKVSVNTFAGDALTSVNVVNFIPEGTIYIHSNIVSDETDVLQEIYSNNTVPFSNITYQLSTSPDTYSKRLSTTHSNTFEFAIRDEEDDELLMNGQNLLITLLLYKKDDFTSYFKRFIQWTIQKIESIFPHGSENNYIENSNPITSTIESDNINDNTFNIDQDG
jgi:hypothetical protein